MKPRRTLINVIANEKIGLGHVYNILTILPYFSKDEILIVMNKENSLGKNKFQNKGLKIKSFKNENELFDIIKKFDPHIIMNDTLDTKIRFSKKLQKTNCFIVNFEDMGPGSNYVNLVFNPIYNQKSTTTKFFGEKYACVREEFRNKITKLNKKSIVITFGGADPKKISLRLLKIFQIYKPEYKIYVIIGNGFSHKNQILKIIKKLKQNNLEIEAVVKTDRISKYIDKSMFAITANGRTVFEVAARNVPIISISANQREETHEFSKNKKIGYHLGLHSKVSNEKILESIKKMEIFKNRNKFEKRLKKIKIQNSVDNVKNLIEKHYKKWSQSMSN